MQKWPECVREVVIRESYGRAAVMRDFIAPDGAKFDDYLLWVARKRATIVLPVSTDGEVIYVKQYRFGVKEPVIEIPGGNPKGQQTPEDVAYAEVEEETGYVPGGLVRLPQKKFLFEPATYDAFYHGFVALGCTPTGKQKPDRTEFLEVCRAPAAKWWEMILGGEVEDDKTIAVSAVALPILGVKLEFP
ncbi:MAG: hypothetical protein A3B37_01720 [Candidatus Sungbacteria bacterium RIFCSPLOWO2_01_FULL_59_16]|uniref:Nudix hydrolase domain-containing protein n=1 Tax=Candidatus Sungbacteria bacterium RIFCSPLOWO2_01_FULL_59_16 TaxID=1802280 RepID=A0A1G2LAD0_9BACT|nr:MAG: hypothetical protein A3B37_01720 [Candidatus Sungbacteria bacterium RIFCSPLOWO2_01_FULL_59_16]